MLSNARLVVPLTLVVVLALALSLSRTFDLDPFGPGTPSGPILFTDATLDAGAGFLHHERTGEVMPIGAGVVIFDFNGDGNHDIYAVDSSGPNALYRNDGNGSFSEMAAAAGLDDSGGRGNGGCAADYDNDGDQDLYVTNYGPSRLFRNSGDETFVDVTTPAGVTDSNPAFRSTGCAWGDYDRDGHLDFIVVRHLNTGGSVGFFTQDFRLAIGGLALYHNEGDGTFADATSLLGDTSDPVPPTSNDGEVQSLLKIAETSYPLGNTWGAGYQPGWADLDNDGDLDLYVVNDFGGTIQPNVLWRNDGPAPDGTWSFFDASAGSHADVGIYGMGLAIGDYDLDGYLDMFMSNIEDNILLKNDGGGLTFTDTMGKVAPNISKIARKPRIAWGAVFFDYDNDGDEDLYVVSGHLGGAVTEVPNAAVQPNVLLRNSGDGKFAKASPASGADDPGIGRGVVYLDFNGDGCLDLFVTNYGQESSLLQNACDTGNSWLVIEPVGTVSNRDGIGARITVAVGDRAQIREVSGGGGQMSQNMLEAHFGLGTATLADSVTIRWPSGTVQTLTNVGINQRLVVTEPIADVRR